jgi:hypothetical protein
VSGLLAGGLYGLLALGLSLSWGLLRLVNLAHFALALLGAYLTYQLGTVFHLSPWTAAIVLVPAFFGLGVAWHAEAPWAEAVAEVLEPWDRNPLLGRLEENRVFHLAESHVNLVQAAQARQRQQRQEAVLRRLLESSAFAVAERLSRLRQRAGIAREQSVVSKDEVRRALGG